MNSIDRTEGTHSLNTNDRNSLLLMAKQSIQHGLTTGNPLSIRLADYTPSLTSPGATFITLEIEHQLRGCIGTLLAYQPLIIDVSQNAFNAAFRDSRFKPLNSSEFASLSVKISLLSQPKPMTFTDEETLLSQVRENIDGLILSDQGRTGTFLPSVWEQLPDKRSFFQQLKIKAGLPKNYWSDTLTVSRYQVEY